ncbi:Quaternary ammonium compound-resistance protein SugE [Brevundimonas sp. SH203]|uniref:DMT family transporter n=1 Tax=Brevundimonas sp. SH203 TaxID=345167 RepID=UPI0009C84766|nr:SMR family transporter [Brevundimonas sp. SH203]GAW41421.1 Quaternary ammonium compound-resistance protein SugE [Brevundimonas sp. SH203]
MSWVLSINPWATLVVAGLLEVLWASGLKHVGLNRPLTSLGVGVALAGSMILLWVATQKLPIGTAYAVWTGIGAVGAAVVGVLVFNEPATAVRAVCILLIVAGIVGLKLFSGATA